jgi:hypothetical protein
MLQTAAARAESARAAIGVGRAETYLLSATGLSLGRGSRDRRVGSWAR